MKKEKPKTTDSVNQDFIRYEQVDKPQRYRLAEASGEEAFDEEFRIRTCDMSLCLEGSERERSRFAAELGEALHEIGFAILEKTGIDPSTYEEAETMVRRLFEETSSREKMKFLASRHGSVNQGYFPIRETSEIHPDLVEGWVFCRRAFNLDPARPVETGRFWPRPEFEAFFREHVLRHERFVLPLARALLRYLGSDEDYFDAKLESPSFGLRLNYYPPVEEADRRSGAGRLLGHEDVDLFTLVPAPQIEGLQVLNRRNGKWIRLNAPRGSLILNTGDYMQRISNDILPSTTHRVSTPRDRELLSGCRVSFPLNIYLREEEMLEVLPGIPNPRYEPVQALRFHTRITSKYYGDSYAVDDPGTDLPR